MKTFNLQNTNQFIKHTYTTNKQTFFSFILETNDTQREKKRGYEFGRM